MKYSTHKGTVFFFKIEEDKAYYSYLEAPGIWYKWSKTPSEAKLWIKKNCTLLEGSPFEFNPLLDKIKRIESKHLRGK